MVVWGQTHETLHPPMMSIDQVFNGWFILVSDSMEKIKVFLFIILASAWLWIKPLHLLSHHLESQSESCVVCIVVDHQQLEMPPIEFLNFCVVETQPLGVFFKPFNKIFENFYYSRGPPIS